MLRPALGSITAVSARAGASTLGSRPFAPAVVAIRTSPLAAIPSIVPLAASVELLHTATLIHDDVIDAAQERRGKPTAAALFNNASSVMLGDYMFAHAAEFVARTGNIRVIRNFADTLRVMTVGAAESLVTLFVGFAALAFSWILVAVGMSRKA